MEGCGSGEAGSCQAVITDVLLFCAQDKERQRLTPAQRKEKKARANVRTWLQQAGAACLCRRALHHTRAHLARRFSGTAAAASDAEEARAETAQTVHVTVHLHGQHCGWRGCCAQAAGACWRVGRGVGRQTDLRGGTARKLVQLLRSNAVPCALQPSRRPELLKLAKEINFCPYTREDIAAMFRGNYKDTYNLHHAGGWTGRRLVWRKGSQGAGRGQGQGRGAELAACWRPAAGRLPARLAGAGPPRTLPAPTAAVRTPAVEAMRIVDEHGKSGYDYAGGQARRVAGGRLRLASPLALPVQPFRPHTHTPAPRRWRTPAAEARVATMREVDEHDKSGYDYAGGQARRVAGGRGQGRGGRAGGLLRLASPLALPVQPFRPHTPALCAPHPTHTPRPPPLCAPLQWKPCGLLMSTARPATSAEVGGPGGWLAGRAKGAGAGLAAGYGSPPRSPCRCSHRPHPPHPPRPAAVRTPAAEAMREVDEHGKSGYEYAGGWVWLVAGGQGQGRGAGLAAGCSSPPRSPCRCSPSPPPPHPPRPAAVRTPAAEAMREVDEHGKSGYDYAGGRAWRVAGGQGQGRGGWAGGRLRLASPLALPVQARHTPTHTPAPRRWRTPAAEAGVATMREVDEHGKSGYDYAGGQARRVAGGRGQGRGGRAGGLLRLASPLALPVQPFRPHTPALCAPLQ